MRDLWKELGDLFHDLDDEDNGTLPDIFIEGLSGAEVCEIYRWIRSVSEIYSGKGPPTLWHRDRRCDIPIAEIYNPAEMVTTNIAESFRHGLVNLTFADTHIPDLSVAVYPNEIQLDYQMGSDWGSIQLIALFEFLWAIQQMAPSATVCQAAEGRSVRSQLFSDAWHQFKQSKKAK